MFFSAVQIAESVKRLGPINPFFGTTFLVFKKGGLKIGTTSTFQIDSDNKEFLEKYYRPDPRSSYFYRVFRPSDKSKHWNRPDYAAKGLQSVNTRTFGNAFIHEKDTNIWGWRPDYIDVLEKHCGITNKISILDLAVWLYRNRDWPSEVAANDVIATFKNEFRITDEEDERLFEHPSLFDQLDLQSEQATWQELREILDLNPPPDFKPDEGGTLRLLAIQGVGPAKTIEFEPAERLPRNCAPDLAYQWDNFRLSLEKLGNYKGRNCEVVDPFYISLDWFTLDFATLKIEPSPHLPRYLRNRIKKSIDVLHLNIDNNLVSTRISVLKDFADGEYPLSFLERRYPFIAYELRRQGMETKVKAIFSKRPSAA